MARKRFDAQNMIQRVQSATQGLVESDARRGEEATQERAVTPSSWSLDAIQARPGGDTRLLRVDHVLELAESIEGLGLLEPLVVDAKGRLLAGGHRLAACRLLAPQRSVRAAAREHLLALAAPRQRAALALRMEALELRLDGGGGLESDLVPVRVMDFDAAEDPDRALAVEATENGQRRDYTRAEVVQLYRRLLDAGYTDRPGKPRPGERPARPLVATVIGRSVRTVRRLLAEPAEAPHRSPAAEAHAALLELERSLDRAQEALRGLRREEPGVERLLSSLQRSALGDEVRFLREQLAAER